MSDIKVGDEVLAPWMNDGFFYPAIVVALQGDSAHVAYMDGDEGDVSLGTIRRGVLGVGMSTQVNWKGQGTYYQGTIQQRIGQAIYMNYEDGDKGWTTINQCRIAAQNLNSVPRETVACTYCGAPIQASASQCSYCGSSRMGR